MRRALVVLAALTVVATGAPGPVRAANTPPVAVDDPVVPGCGVAEFGGSFPIPEDWTGGSSGFEKWFVVFGSCGPLANDTDPDGDPLTYEIVGQPAHGEALKVDDGMLAYIPAPDFSTRRGDGPGGTWVSDVITYRAFDGTDYSNTASYRLWMAPINDPPSFTPGAATVEARAYDGPVSVPWATNILAGPPNESDQVVSFVVETDTRNAPNMFAVAPAIDANGVLTFTPGTDAGLANVTVYARDNGGLEDYGLPSRDMPQPDDTSDAVTFQVAVGHPLPAPPVAADDTLTVSEDGTAEVDVLANDHDVNGDPMFVGATTDGTRGAAVVAAAPGTVRYTPKPDANGRDTFTYTVLTDGAAGSDTASVHVTILPVNDPPAAVDDTTTVAEGAGPTPVDVLGNDTDIDGDALAVTAADGAGHGTLAVASGSVTYAPDAGFIGTDDFTYTADDGHGGTSHASVAVTVLPDATPPVVTAPVAKFGSVAIGGSTMQIRLDWRGADDIAGVASYELQESFGSGSLTTVLSGVRTTSSTRTVRVGLTTYGYRVRATDRRGNRSAWSAVTTVLPRRYQETTVAARWSGTWIRSWTAAASGGRSLWTASAGRRVTFVFSGRNIGWVGRRGPGAGRAEVRIDGVRVAIVSQSASTTRHRTIVFSRTLSVGGRHTLEIRPLGDGRVDVDAFVTLP
jgi:hypothetical protein